LDRRENRFDIQGEEVIPMECIWKYELKLDNEIQLVSMPSRAELLSVGIQDGKIYLWAKVEPDFPNHDRKIQIFGTGHKIYPGTRKFIGTVHQPPYVWHVFENVG
jgi:hypothetical protein